MNANVPIGPHDPPGVRLAATLRRWGIAILLAGFVAAVLIYFLAPEPPGADLADRIARGRMYRHNVELMGGTAGVLIDDFDRWFASLWHGRALAATVAVIAGLAGVGCLAAARFAAGPAADER